MRLEAIAINQFSPFRPQVCKFGGAEQTGQYTDVHIFVGENGTGKTRLLSLLMAACGNRKELEDRSESPVKAVVAGTARDAKQVWLPPPQQVVDIAAQDLDRFLGTFLGSVQGSVRVSGTGMDNLTQRDGTKAMAFRSFAAVRDEKLKPMGAVNWGEPKDMLLFSRSDSTALCQAVLNMKIRAGMYLAGNPDKRTDRTIQMIERLEKALERITGRPLVFLVEQAGADVYTKVVWGNVRMRLHQLPDGLRAIIGWLAACVARLDLLLPDADNPLEHPTILFIDEPETHLHPAWQRKVIPALRALLPKAQLFVATHSPFVVSSVNEGWIYVLKADSGGVVDISGPKACSKGDTYIDAVEDVLGLKEWYDPETEKLLAQFRALRDRATTTRTEADKTAMTQLAGEIAKRSQSLEVMMGNEIAQFDRKEKSAHQ